MNAYKRKRWPDWLLFTAIVVAWILLFSLITGCASLPTSEAYWEKKWQEMPEADKQMYRDYADTTGLPIAICDLRDCIFVWIY